MKKLNYKVSIESPIAIVYDKMLGLSQKSTYTEWTSIFSPTSSYEGSWETGSKILLVSKDEKGELAGMVSRIVENRVNEFVSIQHYGMLKGGKEITEGPEVEGWSGSLENYALEEVDGTTIVSIEIDAAEEHEEYMDKLYPNALLKLKEICERD
ncbi:MAG: SRPBCC domain-containing protein [Bacteroidia bacterium]|nr:SRPBCC domain-containing protein [Bacteroidia bacterium]